MLVLQSSSLLEPWVTYPMGKYFQLVKIHLIAIIRPIISNELNMGGLFALFCLLALCVCLFGWKGSYVYFAEGMWYG